MAETVLVSVSSRLTPEGIRGRVADCMHQHRGRFDPSFSRRRQRIQYYRIGGRNEFILRDYGVAIPEMAKRIIKKGELISDRRYTTDHLDRKGLLSDQDRDDLALARSLCLLRDYPPQHYPEAYIDLMGRWIDVAQLGKAIKIVQKGKLSIEELLDYRENRISGIINRTNHLMEQWLECSDTNYDIRAEDGERDTLVPNAIGARATLAWWKYRDPSRYHKWQQLADVDRAIGNSKHRAFWKEYERLYWEHMNKLGYQKFLKGIEEIGPLFLGGKAVVEAGFKKILDKDLMKDPNAMGVLVWCKI